MNIARSLIKRVAQARKDGIAQYLLVPDLTPEQLHTPLYNAVVLTALQHLRRKRPYIVACVDKDKPRNDAEDLEYIQSVPLVNMSQSVEPFLIVYLGLGDISPFMPGSEDEFLLFLPEPPGLLIPRWPDIVTELNGILIAQCDDYIKLHTIDTSVMAYIEALPASYQLNH